MLLGSGMVGLGLQLVGRGGKGQKPVICTVSVIVLNKPGVVFFLKMPCKT